MRDVAIIIAAASTAVGVAVAGFLVGDGVRDGAGPVRKVTVRGLSEREVRADLAEWSFQLQAANDDLQGALQAINNDLAAVTAFATDGGLPESDVTRGRLNVGQQTPNGYDNRPPPPRYLITQSVTIRSVEVDLVERLSRETAGLVERGVVLQDYQGPQFVFTDLTAIKPAMIAEATRDARAAAEQFAEDSGARVGGILTASQGYFDISPLLQTNPYASPGEQVEKKVRVVTTVDFELED